MINRSPHYILFIVFFICCNLFYIKGYAQEFNFNFRNFDSKDGLPNNSVVGVQQDFEGFIWIATEKGLSRYDGINFVNYYHDPFDSTSLGADNIFGILVDKKGELWVCADEHFIDKYDKNTNTFIHYYSDYPNANITGITEDNNGKIYCRSELHGLFYVDELNMKLTKLKLNDIDIDNNEINSFDFDRDNQLYIQIENVGLLKINTETGETLRYYPVSQFTGELIHLLFLMADSENTIWLVSENEIGTFKPETNEYTSKLNNIDAVEVRGAIEDSKENIWFAINGLYFYERASDDFTYYKKDIKQENSLASDFTVIPFEDNQGTFWVGHDINGFDHCLLANVYNFKHYSKNGDGEFFLVDNLITCFESKAPDDLWVGTNSGLDYLDRNTSRYKHHIPGKSIIDAFIDKNQTVWVIATERIDNKCRYYIYRKRQDEDSFSLYNGPSFDEVQNIPGLFFEDNDSALWLISSSGMYNIDYEDKSIEFNPFRSKIPDMVTSCYQDNNGTFWIGTVFGLIRYNIANDYWKFYSTLGLSKSGIIWEVYIDQENFMWIATSNGLYKCANPFEDNLDFERIRTKDGLLENYCFNIIEDNRNNLWIGTGNGLVKYNKINDLAIKYDELDGIANKFVGYANDKVHDYVSAFKTVNGELVFGGYNGFNIFHPDSIAKNKHVPPVYFLDFQIFNKSVPIGKYDDKRIILEKDIRYTEKLKLSYKDAVFSFDFIALDYADPSNNQYAYMMEGFEEEWNYVGVGHRRVTYTNLPGGDYTFKVKAANNEGIWNEKGVSIDISIAPPYWDTWLFRISFILIIALLISLMVRYRIRLIKNQKKNLEIKVQERTEKLSKVNNELKERQEVLVEKHEEIISQKEEIIKQKEKIEDQKIELETHKNKLEEIVAERTKDLIIAKEKAEESDKLKSSFLSNMSHEIRTPMNAIMGFSSLIAEPEFSSEEKQSFINQIKINGDNLLQLITDIVDLSKIEAGQLIINNTDFSVNTLLNELFFTYSNDSKLVSKSDVSFQISKETGNYDLYINSDVVRIRQVLGNLIDNAIKFTSLGTITIGYRILNNKEISFFVKDSGIGISKAHQDLIFDRFRKIEDDKTKLYRGAGLGLNISKKIVETLGGKIEVYSEICKGSEFYFSIPLVKSEKDVNIPQKKKELKTVKSDFSKYKVLIVEDEESNFLIIKEILRLTGINIFRAYDGYDAIKKHLEHKDKIDLILMDIKLPNLNGIAATKKIRKIDLDVPIFALTAFAISGEDKEAVDAGCNEYLTKPINKEELINRMKKYLLRNSSILI